MDEIGSPHHRYFRETFGRVEVARDFLRHNLPAGLLETLDLDRLEISTETHVAEDLSESCSDLVYRIGWRGGGGAPAAPGIALEVYVLFEHKSRPEHWTALQVLRYIVAAGERYRQAHPKTKRLPPVYPLILDHGKRRWRAPLRFRELVRPLPPALEPLVPDFRCALHDISPRGNAEIKGAVLTRLALLALRHIWAEEPIERLRELIGLIAEIEDQTEATRILHTLLTYYLSASPHLEEGEVRTLLAETPVGENAMQTIAERWIEQGRQQGWQLGHQEGRQEGHQEGRQEGRQEGEAGMLLRLIALRFGPPAESVRARIAAADAETLLLWSERILTAESLEAVLGR